jgi:hypothetical protein
VVSLNPTLARQVVQVVSGQLKAAA